MGLARGRDCAGLDLLGADRIWAAARLWTIEHYLEREASRILFRGSGISRFFEEQARVD